jgi:multiple antibiotic resistance protein
MAKSVTETAIFPMAIPSIASPGAMLAAVLLTENSRYSLWEQAQTVGMMLLVLLVVLILLLLASHIFKLIGNSGASIISRVMGLILSSVAVSSVLGGIKTYFGL